jgi:thiol-disulfide isomerase/thioredoxin
MQKRLSLLIGLAVVGIIGVIAYVMVTSKPADQATDLPANLSPNTQTSPGTSPAAVSPGAYVGYRPGIIEATKGTKVLFFHAPWCPQCRQLEQSIKTGKIPDGVTIIKVDYDSNQALRQKYSVTIQTTLVRVDDAGKFEKKYVAYESPSLDALVDNLVPK